MLRYKLLSKLHRATVTECDLNYNASIQIDSELLELSGMREYERVEIWDVDNGARFSTYIIAAEPGSRKISINGAAARKVHIGDRIIVVNYGLMDDAEMLAYQPKVIILDANNDPVK
ncbi:MAG: aspartate 1-decarboxylase [Candidatus Cloacimonadaceae bacterium]|jgi:aspartate 1-decarboxylase|nr:aspartate 1-decarboxylase [Candidatus Cloacimonadota bacterium]MDX9950367.1 aspartate 1-decarboxylase [Candidatus Syntrophosphaera sp.]NLN85448.1 aspartate 1-decarboxylase [Candidatus Cloacimonadota bacterium]